MKITAHAPVWNEPVISLYHDRREERAAICAILAGLGDSLPEAIARGEWMLEIMAEDYEALPRSPRGIIDVKHRQVAMIAARAYGILEQGVRDLKQVREEASR